MTYTADELRSLLEQAVDMPYGPSQVAQVEEAIRHADALGDERLRFDARMLGTDVYTFSGEPAKALVTFSWCLGAFDRASERFTPWDDEQLRWHYKWIVRALRDFPEIPLERTRALLDDMERRYRLGGHSLHAVYTSRWNLARHLGDRAEADRWFELWCAAPRDENSDCEGCDPTSKVEHLAGLGRDEEAIALAEPVLVGRLTCHQQPHSMLTVLMVPYLRTGQLDKARDAHLRGYRGFRDRLADLSEISEHIAFCGLTGNEARGLELIERHLDWLDRAPSPRCALRFAEASALVLGRLTAAGRGALTVYRRAAAVTGRAAVDVTVEALADELAAFARAQAARFDARNGTTACGEDTERRLTTPPLVGYLPLSAVAKASSHRTPTRSSTMPAATSGWDGQSRLDRARAVVRQELPENATADELLDRFEHALETLDDEHRALALWEIFDERFGIVEHLTERQRARAVDIRARVIVIRERDHAAAEKPFQEAIERYRRCGDENAARVAETWLGRSLARHGEPGRGVALIEDAVAWLRQHEHPAALTRGELRLAEGLCSMGRFDEALLAVTRAEESCPSDPSRTARLRCGLTSAFCLLAVGRFDEVVMLAESVREQSRELDRPDIEGFANACLGHAFEGMGEYPAAVEAFEDVLSTSEDPQVLDQARNQRAHLLANSARAAEVVDELVEMVADLVARGDETAAASAHFDLAIAYHVAGEFLDAAETAETAVRALGAVGMTGAADRCRYRLSQIYTDLGETDQALAVLDELVARLDGFDNLAVRGQMHEDAGNILYGADREAAAVDRFAAAEQCYRTANQAYDAARVLRARAVAASWLRDPEIGLRALDDAERFVVSLPTSSDEAAAYEAAMLEVDAAQVLANADRPGEAVDRIAGAPGRLRAIGAFGEALEAELICARLLLGLGRIAEGETVLRSVVAASPHDTAIHRSAVWTLIAVLDETGRRVDAAALRAAYDLPERLDDELDGDD
ncbi:MAG: hypothetical protein HKP61_03610 [Dactylosporangium sp.]|nr:hypothetical protein [Dactylosporangium sp.]NNJ60040.1 hypothetical protein [Dactylosporangium sp.]